MIIENKPIVQDLRVFEAVHVSKDMGKQRVTELEQEGRIRPLRTPAGRVLLTPDDAEILAQALLG